MLRIVFFSLFLLCLNLLGAQDSLLKDQLEALSKQLDTGSNNSDRLDLNENSAYDYNQNVKYLRPYQTKERIYIGANKFLGYFNSSSDDASHNVKESTSFNYFKLGYIFKTNNRLELTWIDEADLSYTTFIEELSGLNLNAILPYALNDSRSFHLKLQGGVGIYDYSAYSLEGLSASFGLGIIGDVTEDIEVDIYYLYQYIYWKDLAHLTDSAYVNSTNLNGMSFGVKYKF